jgi:hypothetical protein
MLFRGELLVGKQGKSREARALYGSSRNAMPKFKRPLADREQDGQSSV